MHRSSHVGLAAFLVLQYIVCPTLVTEARGERSRPIDGKKSNVCYQLRPVRGNAQGGHIFRCFRNRPMSFEGCRLLLAKYTECAVLTYGSGVCSLHANYSRSYSLAPSVGHIADRSRFTFEKIESPTSAKKCSIHTHLDVTARASFKSCLTSSYIANKKLASLAIVMSVTDDWTQSHRAGFDAVTSNFDCYCKLHNYTFIVNKIGSMPANKFFHERHSEVLQKYLPRFQYVMHIDADSLVLNMNQPLDRFMNGLDVQLHLHESGEVTASNYLVKNSLYGRCFLQYWANFKANIGVERELTRYDTLNYDNGDLMAAVMNLFSPKEFVECMSFIGSMSDNQINRFPNPYLQLHIECWKHMHDHTIGGALAYEGVQDTTKGLRVYFPREGYWRTHARTGRFGLWWDQLFGSCYKSSDIIGHGWKAMPRKMWGGNHSCPEFIAHGTGSNYQDAGYNKICNWLSTEQELDIARRFCLRHSPVCSNHDDSGNACIGDMYACTSTGSRFSSRQRPAHVLATREISRDHNRYRLSSVRHRGVRNTSWNTLAQFDVGNEEWWRQQLCSWC